MLSLFIRLALTLYLFQITCIVKIKWNKINFPSKSGTMHYSSPILIFVVLCSVGAQDLPILGTLLGPGPEVSPPEGDRSILEEVPVVGKVVEGEVPVIYDAYFGKPITTKRSNFLQSVLNGTM